MQIGAAAGLAGTTTKTIRHYHRVGVLPEPVRLANGYRDYDTDDVARLLTVLRLRRAGVRLSSIADVLLEPRRRADFDLEIVAAIAGIDEAIRDLQSKRRLLEEAVAESDPWSALWRAGLPLEATELSTPDQRLDANVLGSLLALNLEPRVREQLAQITLLYRENERLVTTGSASSADAAAGLAELIAALPPEVVALVASLVGEYAEHGTSTRDERERTALALAATRTGETPPS